MTVKNVGPFPFFILFCWGGLFRFSIIFGWLFGFGPIFRVVDGLLRLGKLGFGGVQNIESVIWRNKKRGSDVGEQEIAVSLSPKTKNFYDYVLRVF